jgi:hypothetical protein
MARSHDDVMGDINRTSARISLARDADIVWFCGNLYLPEDRQFANVIRWNSQHKNLFLILSTFGGSPNSAYRIGRCLPASIQPGDRVCALIL